jgi:hypothetical protein
METKFVDGYSCICKKCNGVGIRPDVIESWVANITYQKLIEEHGQLDLNDDLEKVMTEVLVDKESWWLDTERKVIQRFKLMNIVEDDGIWCDICKGLGKVDWVTYTMGC